MDIDRSRPDQPSVEEQREMSGADVCCRICSLELLNKDESMKLECSCKGEMALAHTECVIRWFSICRTGCCDICKTPIANLPPLREPEINPQAEDEGDELDVEDEVDDWLDLDEADELEDWDMDADLQNHLHLHLRFAPEDWFPPLGPHSYSDSPVCPHATCEHCGRR